MGPSWGRTSQMTVLIPARPQSSGGAQIWLFRAPKADAELVRTLNGQQCHPGRPPQTMNSTGRLPAAFARGGP